MIYNYEIKQKNNEEVLYLYLDLTDEFAKLNWKEKSQKLEDMIRHFIKENKIDFAGKTVAIIASGIVVGTLMLNNPTTSNSISSDNYTIIMSENLATAITNPKIELTNTEEAINQEVTEQVEEQTNQIEETNQNQTTEATQIISSQVISNTQTSSSDITSTPSQEQAVPEVQETKTYVTIHRTNGQVIQLELEEYIIGVVGAEMPAAFHDQALMSQAIIARTYALKAINRGITLTDNSSTQNYKSNTELQALWGSDYNYYYNKIKNAVDATKGMYLTYNGTLIEAVYHSTSNGTTEDSRYVWGNYFPYLVSVESVYDSSNPSFQKEQFISYQELTAKLGTEINNTTDFNVLSKTSGNRIEKIEINGNVYTGVQIRNLLGLRSTDFELIKTDTGITFVTKGYGHGVGLSQYGANGMAKAGYSYEQILKHYYSGVTLNQI